MSIFVWSDSFLTGIQEVDEHHKHLVELLNLSYDCFMYNNSDQKMELLVQNLVRYANYHFEAEESLMKANNYPFFEEHRQEHIGFASRTAELQSLLHDGCQPLDLEILQFLKDWLADHILNSDKKMSFYLLSSDMDH